VSDLREDWMRHADQVLADEQMWRPNTDAWALRGHLDSVAATIIDGETASRLRQERLAGSRSREERSQRPVAGPRSSSGRFNRRVHRAEIGELSRARCPLRPGPDFCLAGNGLSTL